jgi:hypothetical protein
MYAFCIVLKVENDREHNSPSHRPPNISRSQQSNIALLPPLISMIIKKLYVDSEWVATKNLKRCRLKQ